LQHYILFLQSDFYAAVADAINIDVGACQEKGGAWRKRLLELAPQIRTVG
jgi:hypothetical protein